MEDQSIDWVQRSFRFEKPLDEWIFNRAKKNLRSLNSEVVHILLQEKEREATDAS